MEIGGESTLVSNLTIAVVQGDTIPNILVDDTDVLCQPMLEGSSTDTSISLGGSANNCLDT